jgi:hypothetical protein
MDVVPVEPGTEDEWQQEPFGGRISDGYIWGRGAIDNKSAVLGTLEAVEMLLADGFRPTRTVYLAYGHDEEVGGTNGARAIAALLESRGVALDMVLDEGGVIGDGVLPGITAPVALVGIAEKGFVTLELSARVPGGHSSLPPRQGAVGIVSAAIAKLDGSPMPARLEGPTQELFNRIGPRFPMAQRAALANLWLTRPLVARLRRPGAIFPRSRHRQVAVTDGSVTRNSNEIGVGSGPIRPKVADSYLVGTRRFSSSGQSKFANTSQLHRSNLTADQPHKRTDKGGVRCGQAQRR